MRHDFSARTKTSLAKRVNYHCSNPLCRRATTGPHRNPAQSVNIGVAAHITAAAPGGPRFNGSMSPEARSSAANGIWLCQVCAKLVDSDAERYLPETLVEWKSGAEALSTWELESRGSNRFSGLAHAPIPPIYGVSYDAARARLLSHSWQPYMRHWSHGSSMAVQFGNGAEFWKRGYHEMKSACPTGYAFCRFEFKDVYDNTLAVVTAGEEDPEAGYHACVVRWFFDHEQKQE